MADASRGRTHVSGVCFIMMAVIVSAGFPLASHAFSMPSDPRQTATEDTPDDKRELCKKIIEKIYQAYGGRERISEIKDSSSIAQNRVLPQGLDIMAASYMKMPNKIRIDMDGMQTMVFDGKSGWATNPSRRDVLEMTPNVLEDFKRSSWAAQGMLNPEIMNISPTLEGRAPIDGKDYIVIRYADCGEFDFVYVYVDPETFLPHLFAYVKPNLKIQAIHSDYREIDGLKVPYAATGAEPAIKFLGPYMKSMPESRGEIKRVTAEGDLVAIHNHVTSKPGDRGRAVVDIFRVVNGRVVEHWDVVQDVPEKSANENTMF